MAGRISGITIEIGGDTTKLQTALKGVDGQLKNTQAALKDVNKLLKLDPGNHDLLIQKQKNLEKAVDQTKQRLQQLKDAQKSVSEGTPEWDALQREIIATEQQLKDAESELQNFGSVGAQQVAAVGQAMQDLGGKVSAVGQALAPVSAAAGAVASALVGLGINSMTTADDLNTLSAQTGLSTDMLQMLAYASDRLDVSTDTVTGAVTKMTKAMGTSPGAFEALGVSVTDAEGHMRDSEDVFMEVLDALSQIPNEVERDQAAMEIFGKSATELAGLVDDGGASLREYGEEAKELGLILSGDTLAQLNQTNDAIDKSKAQLKAAGLQLGATVAQGLAPAIEKLAGFVEKLVGWLQQLTPEQTNLIVGIASVIAAVAPVLIVGGKIIAGIGKLLTIVPALVSAFSFLISPIGLVIAAIAAAIAIGVILYKNWDTIKAKAKEIWSNIVTTVTTFIANLKQAFSDLVTNAVDSITGMWDTIKEKFTEAVDMVKEKIQAFVDAMAEKVAEFIDIGKNIVNNIKDGIAKAWDVLVTWFTEIWDKLFGNRKVTVTAEGEEGGGGTGAMTGLDFVPFNGFPAVLHRGEAVLTAGEAQHWREGGGGIDYDRLAAAIASRPIQIVGDTGRIFKIVQQQNLTRTRATNYNALAARA